MKTYTEKLEKIRTEINSSYSLLEDTDDLNYANWSLGYAYGILTILSSNIQDLLNDMKKEEHI